MAKITNYNALQNYGKGIYFFANKFWSKKNGFGVNQNRFLPKYYSVDNDHKLRKFSQINLCKYVQFVVKKARIY